MSLKAEILLFPDRPKRLETALKAFMKTEVDLDQDVGILKDWIKSQPHLPETPGDDFLTNIVLLNKFSIEKSKKHIDTYYTLKVALPEIFLNKNFRLPHMKIARNVLSYVPMPKLTEQGYRISVLKIHRCDTELFSLYDITTVVQHLIEIRMMCDVMIGEIMIVDAAELTFGLVSKITPVQIKKTFISAEKVYKNIMKQLHYINVSSVTEGVVSVVKQLVSKKLSRRVYAHKNVEGLRKYISEDLLPIEYGGSEYKLSDLAETYGSLLEKFEYRLNELESMKTDESKRPGHLENDEILGIYGNFKKLNVD